MTSRAKKRMTNLPHTTHPLVTRSSPHCSAYAGAGIYMESSATIADCEILQNEADASIGWVFAYGPVVTILRCIVSGNGADWRSIGGLCCVSPALTIRECLITDNWESTMGGTSSLYAESSVGTIADCTVAYNEGLNAGDPAVGIGEDSDIVVEQTIIAFNRGTALACSYDADVNVRCCDLYGNTAGNEICGDDQYGNFSADPLFCDVENDD